MIDPHRIKTVSNVKTHFQQTIWHSVRRETKFEINAQKEVILLNYANPAK